MAATAPNLNALTKQFAASPTVETLRRIIQSVKPYCLRTRLPRYNQAAIAATVFERTRDGLKLPASILTQALKAEACWDAWGASSHHTKPAGRPAGNSLNAESKEIHNAHKTE